MRSPSSKSTAAPLVTVEEAQAAYDSPRSICGEIVLDLESAGRRIDTLATGECPGGPVRSAAYRAGAMPGPPATAVWDQARFADDSHSCVYFSQWVERFREAADATPESRFKDWCEVHLECKGGPPIEDAGSVDANIEAAAPLIEAGDYKAAWCHLGLALRDLDPGTYPEKFACALARLLFCVDGMDEEAGLAPERGLPADFIRKDVSAALEEHLIPRLDEQQLEDLRAALKLRGSSQPAEAPPVAQADPAPKSDLRPPGDRIDAITKKIENLQDRLCEAGFIDPQALHDLRDASASEQAEPKTQPTEDHQGADEPALAEMLEIAGLYREIQRRFDALAARLPEQPESFDGDYWLKEDMGARATSNFVPGGMFGEGPIAEARYLEDVAADYRAALVSEASPAA